MLDHNSFWLPQSILPKQADRIDFIYSRKCCENSSSSSCVVVNVPLNVVLVERVLVLQIVHLRSAGSSSDDVIDLLLVAKSGNYWSLCRWSGVSRVVSLVLCLVYKLAPTI